MTALVISDPYHMACPLVVYKSISEYGHQLVMITAILFQVIQLYRICRFASEKKRYQLNLCPEKELACTIFCTLYCTKKNNKYEV